MRCETCGEPIDPGTGEIARCHYCESQRLRAALAAAEERVARLEEALRPFVDTNSGLVVNTFMKAGDITTCRYCDAWTGEVILSEQAFTHEDDCIVMKARAALAADAQDGGPADAG